MIQMWCLSVNPTMWVTRGNGLCKGKKLEATKKQNRDMSTSESQNVTEQIFNSLKLKSFDGLDDAKREKCPGCDCSRLHYCHKCFCTVGDSSLFPKVHLPIDLEIVHHPKEKLSKSTIPHAMVIADNAHIHEYREVELDFDEADTVILYPGENAIDIQDLDLDAVKRVVVIDGTWSQAKTMSRDPALTKLKQVKIGNYETMFWRHQQKGKDHLATIEAIYYFYRELYTAINAQGKGETGVVGSEYAGEADNLLFFYMYKYRLIQKVYKEENKEFRKIDGWVKLDKDEKKDQEAQGDEGDEGDHHGEIGSSSSSSSSNE
eukprot:TRINITY_DN3515_c1_g2_i1.p1 TRINITY_DN3515_c1_g2~~TRINITY_DN3515_c1_g2_i1.p1  ORF type:complete len:318 (-),score=87.65 TRINITY_DN3515_c1_g2_i1:665-1618(-)